MNRRQLIAAAFASLAAFFIGSTHPQTRLRNVFKLDKAARKWVKIRMFDAKPGDVIAVEEDDQNTFSYGVVEDSPSCKGGVWGVGVTKLYFSDLARY